VSCTTADFYLEASSRKAGAAAEFVASNKMTKYAGVTPQGEFVPTAMESHGPINRDALQLTSELGSWRLELRSIFVFIPFLFQQIFVVVQRFDLLGFAARCFSDDNWPG